MELLETHTNTGDGLEVLIYATPAFIDGYRLIFRDTDAEKIIGVISCPTLEVLQKRAYEIIGA